MGGLARARACTRCTHPPLSRRSVRWKKKRPVASVIPAPCALRCLRPTPDTNKRVSNLKRACAGNMSSQGIPTSADAYNNLGDGDMSTMFGNDRGSIDLSQRSAMGGEGMPSARMPLGPDRDSWPAPPPQPTPQTQTQTHAAHPAPSPAPAPAPASALPLSELDFRAKWHHARLARLPGGIGVAMAHHPTVRALLDQHMQSATPHNEAEQVIQLGVVVGQVQAQMQAQMQAQAKAQAQAQVQAKAQAAQAQAAHAAQAQAQAAAKASHTSSVPTPQVGGVSLGWIAMGIAGLVVLVIVAYAWSTGVFSRLPPDAASAASVAAAAAAFPGSSASSLSASSPSASSPSALAPAFADGAAWDAPPSTAYETLAALAASGPMARASRAA